jgi:hypothetical protein
MEAGMNLCCPKCNTPFVIRKKNFSEDAYLKRECKNCGETFLLDIGFIPYEAVKGAPWRLEMLRRIKAAYQNGGPRNCSMHRLYTVPPNLGFRMKYIASLKELVFRGLVVDAYKMGKRGDVYGFVPANAPEVVYWSLTEPNKKWKGTNKEQEEEIKARRKEWNKRRNEEKPKVGNNKGRDRKPLFPVR